MLSNENIIANAIKQGFHQAAIIETKEIVFDPSFRPYCEENLCGQYGANYSCPPECGSPEKMRQRILKHKYALVLRTEWNIPDWHNKEDIKRTKGLHNSYTMELVKVLRENGHNGIIVGASGCSLCSPCEIIKGNPCRFPDLRYSCMSAYCIYVKKLAESCGMKYDYENNTLPFFGMYVFD